MALGVSVFHRERVRDKQRNWIGAQKRASLLRKASDEESTKLNTQEAFPMIQSRASLAQARGERPLTVSWG
jgi:leucyl-tRNA synthetase